MKRPILSIILLVGTVVWLSPTVTKAVSITPEIGNIANINVNMTTDVTISSMTADIYRLYVFKGDNGAHPSSWSGVCAVGNDLYYVASANITNGNPADLANTAGGITTLSKAAGEVKVRVNVNFSEVHSNPPGASLVYALFDLNSEQAATALGYKFCNLDFSTFLEPVAYAVKGPFAVVNNGGGGGTTPVRILSPDEIVSQDFGDATLTNNNGGNYLNLANLFVPADTEALDIQTVPIVTKILKSLFYLAGLLLLLTVIYAGIVLLRSTSDEEAVVAKKNLTWALIGSFLVVGSQWIINTIINFI